MTKLNGKKYPRGNREWYFTNSKLQAVNLAIMDYENYEQIIAKFQRASEFNTYQLFFYVDHPPNTNSHTY